MVLYLLDNLLANLEKNVVWLFSRRNSVVLRISLDNASFGLSMLAHSSLLDSLQRTDSSPVNTLISPPTGWVKLNADGAVAATNAWAAAGRILRDESGNWLLGYNRYMGLVQFYKLNY